MKRKNSHPGSPTSLPADAPRQLMAVEFGRRLQAAMNEKGWTQSELARRATTMAPEGLHIGRDNISTYINGKVLPNPVRLETLAKTLDVTPEQLLPSRGVTVGSERVPPFDMRALENGNVWLRINREVPVGAGLRILSILDELEGKED